MKRVVSTIVAILVIFLMIMMPSTAEFFPIDMESGTEYMPIIPIKSMWVYVDGAIRYLPITYQFGQNDRSAIVIYSDNYMDITITYGDGWIEIQAFDTNAGGAHTVGFGGYIEGYISASYRDNTLMECIYGFQSGTQDNRMISFGAGTTANLNIKKITDEDGLYNGINKQIWQTGYQEMSNVTFNELGMSPSFVFGPETGVGYISRSWNTERFLMNLSGQEILIRFRALPAETLFNQANAWTFFNGIRFPYEITYENIDPAGVGDFMDTAVGGFFDMQILPSITLGMLLVIPLSVLIVVAFLKIFAGG